MRCPKCHYISFDSGDRCRNCGYDFSLSVDVKPLDLPIQTGDEPTGPLADLRLGDSERGAARAAAPSQAAALDAAPDDDDPSVSQRQRSMMPFDLPLFSTGDPHDDRPLVTPPAVPRAPLAVRRGTPAVARSRPREVHDVDEPALALEEPDEPPRRPRISHPSPRIVPQSPRVEVVTADYAPASLIRRIFGGIIDAVIIMGIDAAVVYFTLKLCGLRLDEAKLLPIVPFLTFVLLLNGGYLSGFVAAGGQTIGKMAAGTRVVRCPGQANSRVSFGYAVLRAAAYLVSVLPAGLGLLPALFAADHRTLHDRLADTRVVRS